MKIDFKGMDLRNIDFKDPKVQRTIVISLFGLIALVAYILLMFLPQAVYDINMVGKTLKMRSDLKEAGSLISEKETLKKKATEYKNKIEVYEKKLPAQREIPNLLENLSKMARNANITIVGITPVTLKSQKEKTVQVYQEIPILITARSGYHELGRFLSNLENGDRFMKVVGINIKTNAATPKKHDIDLTVHTYVLAAR